MLRVASIRFTEQFEAWGRLLRALGMVHAVRDDGWWEFDSRSGAVRLHSPDEDRPAGSTLLAFEVGDLAEFARRTIEDGTDVALTQEPHGATATISGPDGLRFVATAEERAPEPADSDPMLHVLPIWLTPDIDGAAATLRHIGARPDVAGSSDDWRRFTAKNGGLVAAHAWESTDITLSFQYDGPVADLLDRLLKERLEASLVDGPGVRTLLVPDPDGGAAIWITEET